LIASNAMQQMIVVSFFIALRFNLFVIKIECSFKLLMLL
jgi:hypothetical protein